MRRLLFALAAALVVCAGCSLLASHSDDAERAYYEPESRPWVDSFLPTTDQLEMEARDSGKKHK
jgi:hypothetical protein